MYFGAACFFEAAFAIGAIAFGSLLLALRQTLLLRDATLIRDNRIISVSPPPGSIPVKKNNNDTEETVGSTFGVLIGSKIYRWGLSGVHGVRLNCACIDKERIYLTFGDAIRTIRLEVLHGMTQNQTVLDAAQKLWYETGISAGITGW